MNNINDQKFFIIAQLFNTLRGTSRMIGEDRKMTPTEKKELLEFMGGLKKHIIEYNPELIKNRAFFEKSEDDGSR